jgi:hypothetical protein
MLAAVGLVWGAHATAGEPVTAITADAVFRSTQSNWVQPVNYNQCAPGACDAGTSCGPSCGCGSSGCGLGGCGLGGCGGCGLGGCGGELGDAWTLTSLFGDDPCFTVGGWWQAGYHNKSDGIFNTYPNKVQLQQGYLYLEKVADGSEGLGFGGRVDVLYGTDGPNTQSFGNDLGVFDFSDSFNHGDVPGSSTYGWAIPQLYAEVAYHDVSVKLGHFYTLLGYQVVPATGNFFYSIPWTFNFSEAFTHTGALATYTASDDVTLYGGWTLGWDTGFDQFNGGNSFLGGASVALTDDVKATYILTAGNLGWIGEGYTHSFVLDWVISDKWEYVAQSDYVHTDASVDPFGRVTGGYNTIGVNQYLFYTINDKLRTGVRGEWWKANGISVYDFTAGVNIKPHANLLIRPEWRYRWSPTLNDDPATDSTFNWEDGIFGIDAILTF